VQIDLHFLNVPDAINITEQAIFQAQMRGDAEIRFIVGKGIHSDGGAKIKPAVQRFTQMHHLFAAPDANNAGIIVVAL
ncbi:hypothetical protein FIBSPDRAFT_849255, partial [Athelia psychrophila]